MVVGGKSEKLLLEYILNPTTEGGKLPYTCQRGQKFGKLIRLAAVLPQHRH